VRDSFHFLLIDLLELVDLPKSFSTGVEQRKPRLGQDSNSNKKRLNEATEQEQTTS